MIVPYFFLQIRQDMNGLLQASIGNLHPRHPNLSCMGYLHLDSLFQKHIQKRLQNPTDAVFFPRLVKGMKYFFEVLLKQNTGVDHLEVAVCTVCVCYKDCLACTMNLTWYILLISDSVFLLQWRLNHDDGIFSVITSEFLSLYEGMFASK